MRLLFKITFFYELIKTIRNFGDYLKHGNLRAIIEKTSFNRVNFNIGIKNNLKLINSKTHYEKLEFVPSDNPLVSIIIPVHNQFEFTYKCLKSIHENTFDIAYEIIIADDASTDETVNLSKYIKNVRIIRNKEPLGFLKNCNKVARFAKGKYLHFLNNDTQVQPHWLSSLIRLIEADEKIGIVGSKLVYPTGRLQEAGGIIWNDANGYNFGRLDDPTKPEYNYVKEVDYISGASILIRKKLWEEIGGFDEKYSPAYYEDTDLAFEVRKRGYKVVYQPQSIVVHFEGISHGTNLKKGIKKYQVINKQKFLDKWKNILEASHKPNGKDVFLARDRSFNKKHLLFIDYSLPYYDKHAGNKATFQYLQMFINMDYKVHFITNDFRVSSENLRYLEPLTQMGIEVLYGNWYQKHWKSWIKKNGKYLDYVILSTPFTAIKYINSIKKYSNAKIVYFGHDLHFLRKEREYKLKKFSKKNKYWIKRILGKLKIFLIKKIEISIMKQSDISYYFSNIEKTIIQKIDSSIKIEVVPLYMFQKFKKILYSPKDRENIMFVGGFRHPPNVDAVLWFIKEIFPKIKKQIPKIKFYIIGSNPPKEILNLSSDSIIVTGFITNSELENFYKKSKIVVAPLRYGAGVKGKIIEALYYGMPIVTTSIGAEGIQETHTVMKIADEPSEFATKVIELYFNDKELKRLSSLAQEYCKKYFSFQRVKSQICKFFECRKENEKTL